MTLEKLAQTEEAIKNDKKQVNKLAELIADCADATQIKEKRNVMRVLVRIFVHFMQTGDIQFISKT